MITSSHGALWGKALAARSIEEGTKLQFPNWAWGLFLVNFIVFLPILIYSSYTLGSLFPILAIVENPNPPAYERVPLNDDTDAPAADGTTPPATDAEVDPAPPKPISASVRALNRLLYSVAGWRANFRGIVAAAANAFALNFAGGLFTIIPFVGSFLGTLFASLALVQLSTVWVHIVISPPNKAPFYRRLPPLRRTFEATCFPVLATWLATALTTGVPLLIASALGLPQKINGSNDLPNYDASNAWKVLVVGIVAVVMWAFLYIPAHVLLVRVQASLLPPEEDTIVPVDRSFGNSVEPVVVGGKGFVTMKAALKTVSRASWIRIYVLYAKLFVITLAINAVLLAIIIPQVIFVASKGQKGDGDL